jgi:hypothetical protein
VEDQQVFKVMVELYNLLPIFFIGLPIASFVVYKVFKWGYDKEMRGERYSSRK